jgi:hypothetical protein
MPASTSLFIHPVDGPIVKYAVVDSRTFKTVDVVLEPSRLSFKRIGPGYYATEDDRWEIVKTAVDPAWGSGFHWVASLLGGRAVMDPFKTLGEAKEAIEEAVADEAADPVLV